MGKLLNILLLIIAASVFSFGQKLYIPDAGKINDGNSWKIFNRSVDISSINDENVVHIDSREGDGVVILDSYDFDTGTILLDVKGKDAQGSSFVGIAFHVADEKTYDAVYFRPFNFGSSDSAGSCHCVQYISMPDNGWQRLREEHPGMYEKAVVPVPAPDEFFHVKIVIEHPVIKVFVNNSTTPSLVTDEISAREGGQIAFWVGNNSEGWFKNLRTIKKI